MPEVLPARPRVRPVRVFEKFSLLVSSAAVKEADVVSGSTVAVPVPVKASSVVMLMLSARTTMWPVWPLPPKVSAPPEARPLLLAPAPAVPLAVRTPPLDRMLALESASPWLLLPPLPPVPETLTAPPPVMPGPLIDTPWCNPPLPVPLPPTPSTLIDPVLVTVPEIATPILELPVPVVAAPVPLITISAPLNWALVLTPTPMPAPLLAALVPRTDRRPLPALSTVYGSMATPWVVPRALPVSGSPPPPIVRAPPLVLTEVVLPDVPIAKATPPAPLLSLSAQ